MMPEDTNSYQPEIKFLAQEEVINGSLWVVMDLQDNGIGWSYEQMPERMWENYHHTQKAIENMGGIFEYHSEYGKGSEVKIKLPVGDKQTSRFYQDWFYKNFFRCISKSKNIVSVTEKKIDK